MFPVPGELKSLNSIDEFRLKQTFQVEHFGIINKMEILHFKNYDEGEF